MIPPASDAPPPTPARRGTNGRIVCAIAFALLCFVAYFTYYIAPLFVIPYYKEKPRYTREMFEALEVAILAYASDHGGELPPTEYLVDYRRNNKNLFRTRTPGMETFRVASLTGPVAYIERTAIADPYALPEQYCPPAWVVHELEGQQHVVLISSGPNLKYHTRHWDIRPTKTVAELDAVLARRSYDPTNGVRSGGELFHRFVVRREPSAD